MSGLATDDVSAGMNPQSTDTSERFARMREAFHRVVDLDLSQRESEIARLSANNDAFEADLRSLLQHTDEADLLSAPEPTALPPQLGPFRPVRKLGLGGMGEVWLAARVEGGFEQQVAIKRVREGALSPELARSFLRERQILARFSHPHIAHLVDGGVGPDGRPWLAMEYIDGQRIDVWCEARKLDVAARVRLFVPICEAVAFAHRNLVIHRDLKPANLLVDADGRPRLLDFGIARLLDPQPGQQTRTLAAMTPAYAAPEQREGGDITTATDVYQLGAVLRQLVLAAADGEVARHSDLGHILDKALMALPAERYAGAAMLSDDLCDWLARRSPRSGIGSHRERLKKILWRWRWPLAMFAAVLTAVGSGGVLALREARAKAREAEVSQQTTQFLTNLFQGADPAIARGAVLSAQDLLDQGSARLHATMHLQTAVRARLLHTIAATYAALGHYDRALSLAEESLAARRVDDESGELAESLDQVGNILRLKAEYGRAEPVLREALDLRVARLSRDDPAIIESTAHLAALQAAKGDFKAADVLFAQAARAAKIRFGEDAVETARYLDSYAVNLDDMGRRTEALALYRHVLAIRESALGPDDAEVATTLISLGVHLSGSVHHEEAARLLERALAIRTRIYGASHPIVAFAKIDLAGVYADMGRLDDAERLGKESLANIRANLSPEHPKVSEALNMLALIRVVRRDFAGAVPLQQAVVQNLVAALGEDHPDALTAKNNLAYSLVHDGRAAEAELQLREVLARKRDDNGQGSAHDRQNLASALSLQGKHAEAVEWQRRAYEIQKSREGEISPVTAVALRELAIAEELAGADAGAERDFRGALALAEQVGKTDPIALRGWRVPLAAFLIGKGRCNEAVPLLENSLDESGDETASADPVAHPQMLLLLEACGPIVGRQPGKHPVDACSALLSLPGVEADSYPTTRKLLASRCGAGRD